MQHHNIPPIFNENSKILILGSFPSVVSRDECFYYANKRNRFWYTISSLLTLPMPTSPEEKRSLLLENNIALWDVIASCDVNASSDSSIKNVNPNDINKLLSASNIKAIFLNGKTAGKCFEKYIAKTTPIPCSYFVLPSTSPANAALSQNDLKNAWRVILDFLD